VTAARTEANAGGLAVKSFVRRFHTEILAEWKRLARTLPAAKQMDAIALIDHMPELLDQIAELAEAIARDEPLDESLGMAARHALDRLHEGFDVSAVVREMSILRGCVLTLWGRENPGGNYAELRALDLAIDHAVQVSVARYSDARDRTLAGIDQISMAALESRSLDDLLSRLLKVFVDTTSSVDTAAIFLRDGDQLRIRAAVGLEQDLDKGFATAIGEGFTGEVAAQRRPLALRSAYLDAGVRSQVLRDRKVRALYGIPLVHGADLIGVAHMGSIVADEFSHDDRQFFASVAARATIGIAHHMLREELAHSEARHKEIATERERALAKLESLLAASPVGLAFLDRELRYLRLNEALASLNGKAAADHIGKSVAEVLPDVAPQLEPVLRSVLDSGQPLTNLPASTPDGRAVLANFFPVRGSSGVVTGIGAVVLNVTDEKRAQEALQREQLRLQSILDHAPAAIWVKDAEGVIVLANARLAEVLGCPHEQLIGRRSEDVLSPEVAAQHREHDLLVMRENRAIEVEELIPAGDKARIFLSIKFPIPGSSPLVGGIATEITERKKIEDELRVAVRTREEVLAIVSHDLRNPLATIQLSVSTLMALQGVDHRGRRHLEMLHRSARRMETLIDDLLDTASIGAGRLVVQAKRESVDSVVSEAVELQRPVADEKSVKLARDRQVEGLSMHCDRDRILQVFGNLIGNAIKFCRAGDTITVACERDGDFVRFCVADTGPGISAEVLPFVFDPYWSGSGHERQGAGLGLYISRGIVETHGGRIWVESTPGNGARFYFTLPIAK
jgi:PAS domain S-box-containing protein